MCVCARARVYMYQMYEDSIYDDLVKKFPTFINLLKRKLYIFLDVMHIFNSRIIIHFLRRLRAIFLEEAVTRIHYDFRCHCLYLHFATLLKQPYLPLSDIIDVAGSARVILPTCARVRAEALMVLSCEFTFRYYLLSCLLYV